MQHTNSATLNELDYFLYFERTSNATHFFSYELEKQKKKQKLENCLEQVIPIEIFF